MPGHILTRIFDLLKLDYDGNVSNAIIANTVACVKNVYNNFKCCRSIGLTYTGYFLDLCS